MPIPYTTPILAATGDAINAADSDLIAIPYAADDDLSDLPHLDEATDGEIARARARGELTGKAHTSWFRPMRGVHSGSGHMLALIGVGPRADVTADVLRRSATIAVLGARAHALPRVGLVYRAVLPVAADAAAQACAEGAVMGNFDAATYRTGGEPRRWVDSVTVHLGAAAGACAAAVVRGAVLGECTNQARALVNEPGNALTPRAFADRARAIAEPAGVAVDVLDEQRIAALKMGLLLGVARGSQEPPRLVVLRHEPANAVEGVVLALIGKGITFDTGGISIKPADKMELMKDDMSGGAAVIAAMAAIARLGAPVRCLGLVPMSENMPGGRAIKPGDILTGADGQTVEILNTDAEGRLVLADAVWYARQLGATHLVDVATLTGACVVALGKSTTGLFGTPDAWVEQVRIASIRAGDRSWPLPVFDDYREQLDSDIADIANSGGRGAGAITGALFIKAFAGGLPWVHMDIAGTAWAEEAKPYQPKGPTGVAVRTLAQLALDARVWAGKLKM